MFFFTYYFCCCCLELRRYAPEIKGTCFETCRQSSLPLFHLMLLLMMKNLLRTNNNKDPADSLTHSLTHSLVLLSLPSLSHNTYRNSNSFYIPTATTMTLRRSNRSRNQTTSYYDDEKKRIEEEELLRSAEKESRSGDASGDE